MSAGAVGRGVKRGAGAEPGRADRHPESTAARGGERGPGELRGRAAGLRPAGDRPRAGAATWGRLGRRRREPRGAGARSGCRGGGRWGAGRMRELPVGPLARGTHAGVGRLSWRSRVPGWTPAPREGSHLAGISWGSRGLTPPLSRPCFHFWGSMPRKPTLGMSSTPFCPFPPHVCKCHFAPTPLQAWKRQLSL